jgi:Flp pilus assembly protein TadD
MGKMNRILPVLLLITFAGSAPAQTHSPSADVYLSRGAQFVQSHMFEQADSQFKQALALKPANPRARLEYAICLFSLGRNNEARRQFEKVRQLAGESRYITYYLGRLDLLSNDYASAIKRLSSLTAKPPFQDTVFYLGEAYISSGNVDEGIQYLTSAAKLMPKDYRVHYRLARAYSTAGRPQDAAREYKLYAADLNERKNTETEVRACSEALRTQPLTAAHEICQRMFDPNDPDKLTLLGQLYGEAGAFQDALVPLTRAVQLDPDSFEAWHNLGLTYFRLKQYQNARDPLQHAVRLRPEAYGSVVLLGATLYMLGDDAAALPVLEHAHRLNPSDAQTSAVLDKLRAEQQTK